MPPSRFAAAGNLPGNGRPRILRTSRNSAPNRPLNLEELDRPAFRRVLLRMEDLLREHPGFYLHPSKQWEYPWALERAGLRPGDRVLDAGCGNSIFPLYLSSEGYKVVALDRELDGSLLQSQRYPPYVNADLTALPFETAAFDAVFCISVIEHLPDEGVPFALQELRRVLIDGGKLLLTTDYYQDAQADLWYEGPDGRFPVDWRIFDSKRLRRLILKAEGWEVEGAVDLEVDWEEIRPRMLQFHFYPYTSIGITLLKSSGR